MRVGIGTAKRIGAVLVDPAGATRSAVTGSNPWAIGLMVLGVAMALGALSLPRQLALLSEALAPLGQVALDMHREAMRSGLTRVILADRLVPSPTIVLAATLIAVVSHPLLSLADDRRTGIWVIALLGLAPLLVQEVGELALTYLAAPADPTPGEAVSLSNRFVTGPLLLWRGETPAPLWLQILDSHINAITLWCLALWTMGLRALDRGRLQTWHVMVPITSMGIAGVITWVGTPLATAALLGKP
ncbi:MAG: hypothetical protein JSW51_03760 [Gemmatimonadota bacterium]|nr:MAG: hypothetical protein JSW51_03760 [Gemmatimonadota bacterium]